MSLIWKIISVGVLTVGMASGYTKPPKTREFPKVSFYVCAHEDDWQLFMGTDAFNDINNYDEKKGEANGTKVVIIYTTAGNLHDDDDTKTCDCNDTHKRNKKRM